MAFGDEGMDVTRDSRFWSQVTPHWYPHWQVKLRGIRLELGEIEAVAAQSAVVAVIPRWASNP